ncbi:MAG: hypothetical protein HWD61_05020 [Parachlamydiaceae bacterium]|nr:MAG: hypothetical protein HWD61_05020 [Parachlamydiaceae bacterium]
MQPISTISQEKPSDEILGPQQVESTVEMIQPEPLIMFIYQNEGAIQGVINSLRKEYPNGIFTTEANSQNLISQNNHRPISAFISTDLIAT